MNCGHSFKKIKTLPGELEVGDGWISLSQAKDSGLILAARVGKHTDELPIGVGD